jgi:hypothetical protein
MKKRINTQSGNPRRQQDQLNVHADATSTQPKTESVLETAGYMVCVGSPHFLFAGQEGSTCCFRDGNLHIAAFIQNPTQQELYPVNVRLGLLVRYGAIFLVLHMGGTYLDMPYFHHAENEIPAIIAEKGLGADIAVCDDRGICRSLAWRSMLNTFSNAFLGAAKGQIANGYTLQQHQDAIRDAYSVWPDAKAMFDACATYEDGWTGMAKKETSC